MQVRLAPDGAADRDPVQPRQHDVENDQVERLTPCDAQPFRAIRRRDGLQSFEAEVQEDELADVRVVLDHEHAAAGLVGGFLRWASPTSVAAARVDWNAAIDLSCRSHRTVKNGAYSPV